MLRKQRKKRKINLNLSPGLLDRKDLVKALNSGFHFGISLSSGFSSCHASFGFGKITVDFSWDSNFPESLENTGYKLEKATLIKDGEKLATVDDKKVIFELEGDGVYYLNKALELLSDVASHYNEAGEVRINFNLPLPHSLSLSSSQSLGEELFTLLENTGIGFDDVGGLTEAKTLLRRVAKKIKHKDRAKERGIRIERGILLYGPPGCGKTLLAKAFSQEVEAVFMLVRIPMLTSMWYGMSEKNVLAVFEKANELAEKSGKHVVLLLDEIDSLLMERDYVHEATQRMISVFLSQLDGIGKNDNITLFGTTNRKDKIDKAILRSGRFDLHIEIPYPKEGERKEILLALMRRIEKKASRQVFEDKEKIAEEVAKLTDGYSGADLEKLLNEANTLAFEKELENGSEVLVDVELVKEVLENSG